LLESRTALEQGAISGKYFFSPGDIVYSKIRPYLRKAIVATFEGLCSADMYPLKPLLGVSSGFVLAVLLDHRFSCFAEAVSARSGIPKINREELAQFALALPPPPEQQAIAAALRDMDALIGALDSLIAKKRDLKQAAMQQLLSGRLRLSGFREDWDHLPFPKVLKRTNAKEYQIQTSEYRVTGLLPVVDQGKDPVVGFSDRIDKRFRCPEGGVIVFGDHTRVVKFVDFDFVVGADGTQILEAQTGQSQNLRFHAFQLQHREIPNTGYNRHFKFLKEVQMAVPPRNEQDAIADLLSDMDAEIAALEARRDKTRALKQGMMQELLTGRVRLI